MCRSVVPVTQKLQALGQPADPGHWARFQTLARLTALKARDDGSFDLGHWWRGPLLYSLVRAVRPQHILEIGTGRGYGALCMAMALVEEGMTGTVWTVDRIPPDRPQPWALDEGQGPRLRSLSREHVWAAHLPPPVRDRIRCVAGASTQVMKRWHREGRPRIDFCFIDGGHDYRTVKRDVLAVLTIANPGVPLLFDDYTDRRGYGVRRVIDEPRRSALPPGATVEIIDLLSTDQTVFGERAPHQMALVHAGRQAEGEGRAL